MLIFINIRRLKFHNLFYFLIFDSSCTVVDKTVSQLSPPISDNNCPLALLPRNKSSIGKKIKATTNSERQKKIFVTLKIMDWLAT